MRRALLAAGIVLLLAVAGSGAALAWLGWTEGGLRWTLERAAALSGGRLRIEEARGTLLGEIRIARARYGGDGFEIEGHEVRGALVLRSALRGRLGVEPLRVQTLRVLLTGPGGGPRTPGPMAMPLSVRLANAHVERLNVETGGERLAFSALRVTEALLGPRAVTASGNVALVDPRVSARVRFSLEGDFSRMTASLTGKAAGVPASATLEIAPTESPPLRAIEALAGPIDPATLREGLPSAQLRARLAARATAGGYAGSLSLVNGAPGTIDAGRLPVHSASARLEAASLERARLEDVRVETAGGGTLSGSAELRPRAAHASLAVRGLDLAALVSTLRATSLAGEVRLALTPHTQSAEGRLAQEGMRIQARVARRGDTVAVSELRAEAQGGTLRGEGDLRLGKAITARARVELAGFNPAAFGRYPVGSIRARLELEGRLDGTRYVDARWRVERSTLAGRALETRGRARFARARVSLASAEIAYGPARATLRGGFGATGDRLDWTLAVGDLRELDPMLEGPLEARGALTGSLSAHALELSARATGAQVSATLAGGWSAAAGWVGEIRSFRNAGVHPLKLVAPAPLVIAPGRAALGRFEARLADGRLLVREGEWRPGALRTSGEFSALPARWLVLAAGAGARLRTTMLLDGSWSISAGERLEGRIEVRRRSGDLSIVLEDEPLALELESAELRLRTAPKDGIELELQAGSRYGRLTLDGEIGRTPGALAPGRLSPLALRVRLEAAALSVLAQPIVTDARLDGRVWAELRATGTLGEPRWAGTVRGEQLSLAIPPYGVHLRNGTLLAELEEDQLRVERFVIRAATGEFSARGTVPLRLSGGTTRLEWSAKGLGVLERPDMRLVVTGGGDAGFDGKRLSLTGRLRADRGQLRIDRQRLPRPGEDVVIAGEPARGEGTRPPLPADLDLTLDLGDNLRLEAAGFEGKLGGELRMRTDEDGTLRAYGQIRSVNAILYAYGQRLEVDPGTLIFDGPVDNPGLHVTAWRRNQAVEAGVIVTGTVQAPRVSLVSVPPVPQSERLSWLVLGRPPAEATKADLGLLQAAAGALLTQGEALPVERRVARAFGLDELTLRGGGQAEGSVVALGKRLSDRLYVSVEQGLGATVTQLVKLDYALGRRWSLRAEAGTTSGAGLFYRFAWD